MILQEITLFNRRKHDTTGENMILQEITLFNRRKHDSTGDVI